MVAGTLQVHAGGDSTDDAGCGADERREAGEVAGKRKRKRGGWLHPER